MKKLIMTALFAAISSSSLMAAQNKTCYPFHPNQEGYNRLCIDLENPRENDTKAAVEIYRNEKLVNTIAVQRIHNPQQQDCTTLSFCFRKYEALRIVPEIQNLNGIELEVFMRVHKRTTCLSGKVTIQEQHKTTELSVECPRTSWEDISTF